MRSRFILQQQQNQSSGSAIISSTLINAARTSYLLSSYYSKNQFPHQQVPVTYKTSNGTFRSQLHSTSKYFKQTSKVETSELVEENEKIVEWPWYGGAPPAFEDISSSTSTSTQQKSAVDSSEQILHKPQGRKYVPLQNVFDIEFRGDHLLSAGMFHDALEHFGVCVKARQAAYPEGHLEITKILIKLSRAFRLCGKPQSAIANLEKCLANFDNTPSEQQIPVEQVCEVVMELGLAHRDIKSDEAGPLLEDVAAIANNSHDFGGSHRHIRLHTRKAKKLNLNFENKFYYLSPESLDRTYNIVKVALVEAEDLYRGMKTEAGNAALVRVLQTHSDITDKKYFNMIYQPGRMRTWGGQNKNKRKWNTSNPSATEVLAFSPTVHQVYHDYSRSAVAPLGREDEVLIAPGARYLDDADPYRHIRAASKSRKERQSAAMEYLANRDNVVADANSYEGSDAVQESLRK